MKGGDCARIPVAEFARIRASLGRFPKSYDFGYVRVAVVSEDHGAIWRFACSRFAQPMIISKFLFQLTAAVTVVFIVTILAMVAMLVGDANAPVNLWFNVHGATVLAIEVIGIGVAGMSAMIADRQETLREIREKAGAARSKRILVIQRIRCHDSPQFALFAGFLFSRRIGPRIVYANTR